MIQCLSGQFSQTQDRRITCPGLVLAWNVVSWCGSFALPGSIHSMDCWLREPPYQDDKKYNAGRSCRKAHTWTCINEGLLAGRFVVALQRLEDERSMICFSCRCPCHSHYTSNATTSISTLISSSPSLVTPTHVQIGLWSGIHFLKLRTIAASASSLIGTWYELTRKTCDHPLPPASFRFNSTLANAWSICALISL